MRGWNFPDLGFPNHATSLLRITATPLTMVGDARAHTHARTHAQMHADADALHASARAHIHVTPLPDIDIHKHNIHEAAVAASRVSVR